MTPLAADAARQVLAADAASQMLVAHQLGSPEFYWALAAELSLVFWTAALVLAPRFGDVRMSAHRFRLIVLGAALLASGVTLAGKTLEVWPNNPLFPSGHTAYSVTIAVVLVGDDRGRLSWALPALALLGVALVLANYHRVEDLVGGALVGTLIGLGVLACLRRRRPAAPALRPDG